jgi:hypothetical protein
MVDEIDAALTPKLNQMAHNMAYNGAAFGDNDVVKEKTGVDVKANVRGTATAVKNTVKFNAKVYEGTPSQFSVAKPIYDCFIQLENPDRDWESRSQVLNISGTLFVHYFNEEIPGNI